ncbi:bleomycin resistance family protein [Fulvitalea axinellae]|uniref:Bleomycin resistance family protein n=1 Tax=Fulvitalea axinellae TaxID=1182444 RepID=A0AAU9DF53_9BACT|nr:bleomycin resistance family protein [Fulvitalea axinellae]
MKLKKLTPNLIVSDIPQTVNFYESVLGFELKMLVPDTQDGMDVKMDASKTYVYAQMAKDEVELMFQREDSFREDIPLSIKELSMGGLSAIYIEMSSVDDFYAEVKGKTENVTEPKNSWYGMREFFVKDPDGCVIAFGEQVEVEAS